MRPGVFSGDDWPQDPRLDDVRDAVWQLSRDGEVVGHLVSTIARMRSFPVFWLRREWMWFSVVWSDGEQGRAEEDYGPEWHVVGQLEQGFYDDERRGRLDARPLTGKARRVLWEQLGDSR